MIRIHDLQWLLDISVAPAASRSRAPLATAAATLAVLASCGLDEPDLGELTSELSVASYITSTCTTAVVLGLSKQIADEVGCMDPTSLVRFSAASGITLTSNAVLPYLAQDAATDLMAVGDVQINSAFRTIAQQYLLRQWHQRGRCGITAAAPVGRSNHESGRAVDLANYATRVTAMIDHHWSHDLPGDPVHFDHLGSADIRGKDTLAFQRLWNRNHPADPIAADGIYGRQTEARLEKSPATGFATGASCLPRARVDLVAVDGPDRIAPGARAHYRITLANASDAELPDTATLVVADPAGSQLHDPTTWTSPTEIGPIGAPIPPASRGIVELDIVAPQVTTPTPIATQIVVTDGATPVGRVDFAVTVTPDGDDGMSGDADDQTDDGAEATGGCSASGGSGAGWLAFAPVLLVIRRRRRR